MASITTRAGKGSPLTNAELDANFNNINAELATAAITGGTINGATIGASNPNTASFTQLDVDNLRLDGNAITSTNTNGNITITPNGTGEVDISKVDIDSGAIDAVTLGTNSAVTEAQIDNVNINGNTISTTNSNGSLEVTPNGTGGVNINGTAAVKLPVGTEAQRPGTPAAGMLRFNDDDDEFEGYNGTAWGAIGGGGGAEAGGAIHVNSTTASVSYTIASGSNGFSVGPITVDTGVTVTVSSGQRWLVL